MTKPDIALIGAGNMGSALIPAMLTAGWEPHQITAVVRRDSRCAELRAEFGINATTDAAAAVQGAGIVAIGVKPYQTLDVLRTISGHIESDAVLVSMVTGVSLAELADALPGNPVVRIMPNTPSAVGRGVISITPGPGSEEHLPVVREWLEAAGTVVDVTEDEMYAIIGIAGSGVAYVYYLIDALAEAGVSLGLSRSQAIELATATFAGAADMVAKSGRHPVVLREQVCSPAGTTIAAIQVLDEVGVRAGLIRAAQTSAAKARQMSGEE